MVLSESGERTFVKDAEGGADHTVWSPWDSIHEYKNLPNLIRSIVWYFEQYKDDPFQTVKLGNGKAATELSFRFDIGIQATESESFLLCGHLDRLASLKDGPTVWLDAKTSKSTLNERFSANFTPNNQMTTYFFASQIITDQPVLSGMIDALQICKDYTAFRRFTINRSQETLKSWHNDMNIWLNQMKSAAQARYWAMNDTACSHYGGCPYQEVCSSSPSLQSSVLESSFRRKPWNPLESR